MENREEHIEERLAELEERVRLLERAAEYGADEAGGGPDSESARDSDSKPVREPDSEPAGEVFWALNRLKAMADPDRGAVLFTGQVPLPTGENYEWQMAAEAVELLQSDWTEAASSIEALGHPVRLTLLQRVLSGVGDTAALKEDPELGTTGQLYHHLRRLTADGWLRSAGRGRYRVPPERIVPLLTMLMAARR
ncbi:helix-turn-helix domain-containing protein [Nocardiopsis sp. RSe5-2]|uniref:Helix-turn-helix domain-containing protein n=1 Tax=Nocardiopsis endophytica TaxID=3018445 RepID=A0ABT4U3Z4_9ACTN|nr:helix-turn-helix domain-containing protein [Nocardiopsis endophytica]MDA2811431.1 helix-turn-helix domain-containing protein [Nocardiopsis endophytica]